MLIKKVLAIALFLTAIMTVTSISMKQSAMGADSFEVSSRQNDAACDTSPGTHCSDSAGFRILFPPNPDNNFFHATTDQVNGCTTGSQCNNTLAHDTIIGGINNHVT